MRSRLFPLVGLCLLTQLTIAGCEVEEEAQSEVQDLTATLTLRFQSTDGTLSLKSSGKLLACTDRFQGLEGERITCARQGEKLQVIVKSTGDSVIAVRDFGKERGYYSCKPSGDDVDGAPALMKCKVTKIRPRGTGGLSSPFDSDVEGITLPNAHWVDEDQRLLRGMEPRTPEQFAELRDAGVEKVVIFKNMTGNDTAEEEIASWDLPEGDVIHVPFHWKDLPDFKSPCEQTLEALRFIREGLEGGDTVFFHCTVGEDRTGYLAAIYAQLFEEAGARDGFDNDMCEHGYGSGNPQKPGFVLGKLEDDLTPLYRSMSFLIEQGMLTQELEASVCDAQPEVPDEFMSDLPACGVSTTLVP